MNLRSFMQLVYEIFLWLICKKGKLQDQLTKGAEFIGGIDDILRIEKLK